MRSLRPIFFLALLTLPLKSVAVPSPCWRATTHIGIIDLNARVYVESSPIKTTWGELFDILKSQEEYLKPSHVQRPFRDTGWKAAYGNNGFALGGASGDLAKVKKTNPDERVILFGDAEGHSLTSAMNSATFEKFLSTKEGETATAQTDPQNILSSVQKGMPRFEEPGNMMALSATTLNLKTGDFTYSNAGMPGLYRIEKSGIVHVVKTAGPPLGVGIESPSFEKSTGHLNPGDLLVYASDGLTDTLGGVEGWNFPTFLREKYIQARRKPKEMVELILKDHPEVFDDRSVLVLKRPDTPASP